jgi:hypothetical protein
MPRRPPYERQRAPIAARIDRMFRFLPQLLRQLHSDEYAALPYDSAQRSVAVALEASDRLPGIAHRLNVPVAPFAYDRRAGLAAR